MQRRIRVGQMKLVVTLVALILCVYGSARADEVTDSIQQALDSYKTGNYLEAAGNLDYAAQLIRQKRSMGLQSILPQPLPGWQAEEAESQTLSPAMFGGMVSVDRQYHRGPSSVTVKIITDSPMLQGMTMLFSNPMLAASDGGSLQKVKGQKAIVKYRAAAHSGDINLVVANRFLVTVEGHDVARQDLLDYAEAIQYEQLELL